MLGTRKRADGRAPWRGLGALFLSLLFWVPRAVPEPALNGPTEVGERTEYFALGEIEGRPSSGPAAVGILRRRENRDGWQLELEILFREEGLRVSTVECLGDDGPRHVFRELGRAGSRTVLAEWREGGRVLHTIESAADGCLRESCDARRGAVMPLYLMELLRQGSVSQGQLNVFDPLTRGLERLRIETSYAPRSADPESDRDAGFRRVVRLLREDGSEARSYVFRDRELEAIRFQPGGPEARRIPLPEFRRWGGTELESTVEADESLPSEVKDVSPSSLVTPSLAVPGVRRVE